MRKLVLFLATLCLLISVSGCLLFAAEESDKPYFELDFDDEPLGPLTPIENVRLIRADTQPQVVESPDRPGKSIMITAPASQNWGDAFYYKLPTPVKDKLTIEAWVYAETDVHRSAILFASSPLGPVYGDGVSLYLYNNGEIRYFDTAFRETTATYKAGQWIHLLVEVNVAEQYYDIYVDDLTTPVARAPFRESTCEEIQLVGFAMYTHTHQPGPVYIDSLIIR